MEFEQLSQASAKRSSMLLDSLEVSLGVRVGQIRLSATELLQLNEGQLVGCDLAGGHVTIVFGENEVAKAQFVVKDSTLSLQITEIISSN